MKEETEEMRLADLSRAIHIALRKGTDSDASVVLWNLMSLADAAILIEIARDLLISKSKGIPMREALGSLTDIWNLETSKSWTPEQRSMDIALRYAWATSDESTRNAVASYVVAYSEWDNL